MDTTDKRNKPVGTQTSLEELYQRLEVARARKTSVLNGTAQLRYRQDGEDRRLETREEALTEITSYIAFLSYLIALKEIHTENEKKAPDGFAAFFAGEIESNINLSQDIR